MITEIILFFKGNEGQWILWATLTGSLMWLTYSIGHLRGFNKALPKLPKPEQEDCCKQWCKHE